ncbi:hypothetical protein INT47_008899 [Mucor saturninus]|uniref:Uncharacterized protein n=1 Tax=Mucor saturninus TaxID=64648 RepID=A0A8H7UWB8_9FUNG|nr:hypothetical protein INT47_008899 [Mucor saturninus]
MGPIKNTSAYHDCKCSECRKGPNGYKTVTRNTLLNHTKANKRAALILASDMEVDSCNNYATTPIAVASNQDNYDTEDESGEEDLGQESDEDDVNEDIEPEEDPFVAFSSNAHLPTDPLAFIFFLTVFLLHGKYLTDEGCELLMVMLNIALKLANNEYKFPARAETFVSWCNLGATVYHGMKEHVSCTACHAVHPYDTEVEKNQLIGKNCSSVEPFPGSTRCGNRLFSVNNRSVLKPIRSFYYNSLVSTLQAFFLREGFVDDVRRWKSFFFVGKGSAAVFQNFI